MADTIKFQLKKIITGPVLTFIMKVPSDYHEKVDSYSTAVTRAVRLVNDRTCNSYRVAERAELLEYIGYLVNFNRPHSIQGSNKRKRVYSNKIQTHIVSLILGDDSQQMVELSEEMAGLVEFAALSEDMSLIYDLQAMGNNKH